MSLIAKSSFFLLFGAAAMFGQSKVSCSSDDMRRHFCAVDTRGGVTMTKQRSDASCIQGRTWGYDRRGIWVDRGCRADFVVGSGYGYGNGRYGNDRYGYGNDRYGYPSGGGYGYASTVSCNSDDMRRHYCPVDTRGGVMLSRQRSDASCIQGRTWGYDGRGIWVDRGCRAEFTVGAGGSNNRGYGYGRDRRDRNERYRGRDRWPW
jgi:hypothetical protein